MAVEIVFRELPVIQDSSTMELDAGRFAEMVCCLILNVMMVTQKMEMVAQAYV
jgi:hypothetical protein